VRFARKMGKRLLRGFWWGSLIILFDWLIRLCRLNEIRRSFFVAPASRQNGISEISYTFELFFRDHSASQVGAGQNRTLDTGVSKIGALEIGISQHSALQVTFQQICSLEVGLTQVSSLEIGLFQIRISQICFCEPCALCIGVFQIGPFEIDLLHSRALQIRARQLRSLQVGALKRGIAQIRADKIGAA